MAAHCTKQQAARSVSAKPKITAPTSTNVTHEKVTSVLKSPKEHRGEFQRQEENEIMPASTGAADELISKAQPDQPTNDQTPQEESTKVCQCAIRQQQHLINSPSEPTIKSNEHDLAPAAHLNYELIAGYRPPPPHYYYAPSFDHPQYSAPHAAFAAIPNRPSYYQNCYPYTFPINLELCYFQNPQSFPTHHTQNFYSQKQQLLFAPDHYNQQQIAYPTTHLTPNNPHSFRNLQSPYQLYQAASVPPFYGPLFPALPPSHHQPASRSHIAHDQPHTYPILPFSCYTQPIIKQSSVSAVIETQPIEHFLPHLPIEAHPAKVRQAYGMDKVWNDEFELLFSHLAPEVTWTFIEVESNPIIIDSDSILAYKGHYIVAKRQFTNDDTRDPGFCEEEEEQNIPSGDEETTTSATRRDKVMEKTDFIHVESDECLSNTDKLHPDTKFKEKDDEDKESSISSSELVDSKDSDCDSGTQTNCSSTLSSETLTNYQSGTFNTEQSISPVRNGNPTTRFRMFIDSAKVRFCCNQCGHGWTSMKGRVVFWYELFELVDERYDETNSSGSLVGYCAYKLFGQQCDICKVENRFERPMWYPEEVSKVLNNMYNKVGQVYFGLQVPTIDKQRRAGKPKTSHNSSLCQACQNGLCTDRK